MRGVYSQGAAVAPPCTALPVTARRHTPARTRQEASMLDSACLLFQVVQGCVSSYSIGLMYASLQGNRAVSESGEIASYQRANAVACVGTNRKYPISADASTVQARKIDLELHVLDKTGIWIKVGLKRSGSVAREACTEPVGSHGRASLAS